MKQFAGYQLLAFAFVFGIATSASFAEPSTVTVGPVADNVIEVKDLSVEGSTVHGVIVNKSSQALRDVRLVIRHAWLWKNERNPGADNPSRSEFYSFPGEIAARGNAPLSYRMKSSLPARADGKFSTSAEVMSYTLVSR